MCCRNVSARRDDGRWGAQHTNIVKEEKQRGTSLAISRFFFRVVLPAQTPTTDSDRIIAVIKHIAMQKCGNAYLRKSTNICEHHKTNSEHLRKSASIYEPRHFFRTWQILWQPHRLFCSMCTQHDISVPLSMCIYLVSRWPRPGMLHVALFTISALKNRSIELPAKVRQGEKPATVS